ncbi:MAG TPA: aminopeptidase P family protein [Ktedonobacteraceae bacterium]|nr:aminopeptidase P family protein [Ktedonobacteraceae bacterium]
MSQETMQQMRTWLTEQGLDAFLVTQPQNRSYLSGWLNDDTEGSGMLLVSQDKQMLLTNPLYQEVAAREAVGWEIVVPPAREYFPTLAEVARGAGWARIGFESAVISYADYAKFSEELGGSVELVPYKSSHVETLRLVKQPEEIELLKRAAAITDATFAHLCAWMQPGMTEKEVQWEIARKMLELGADELAFGSIVASGPNGSMPHAHASQRRIQRGELITIDMGARYKGYCADMTRTICLGEPAETRMVELYEIVLLAMKTCEAGLHAGISGQAADALARDVLASHDLAEYYIHSTGHGIGLQIHEGPSLSQRAPEGMVLPAGSVVTVEPGVYIPGWSGLRIEDSGVVTADGFDILTQSPTQLVVQR